jgi:predicted nuclease of predicted toxin-antitoxin system
VNVYCFLVDECVSPEVSKRLSAAGHDAIHVLREMAGADDEEVVAAAAVMRRILITNDRGVARTAQDARSQPLAVVVTDEVVAGVVAEQVLAVIDRLPGSLAVFRRGKLRISKLNRSTNVPR